jgi:hypothetical protein
MGVQTNGTHPIAILARAREIKNFAPDSGVGFSGRLIQKVSDEALS